MNESMELIPFKWILRGKYGRKSGFCEVNWLRRGGISAPGPPGALGRGRRERDAPRRRRRKAAKMDAPVSASRSLALPRPRDQEKRPSEGGGESSNGSASRSGDPPPHRDAGVLAPRTAGSGDGGKATRAIAGTFLNGSPRRARGHVRRNRGRPR